LFVVLCRHSCQNSDPLEFAICRCGSIGADVCWNVQGSASAIAVQLQPRAPFVLARWAGIGYLANTRLNWCSDSSSLATAPLRSQWFGTRNNTGHRLVVVIGADTT